VRSFMRCEAIKMLPCRWSMREEKRLVTASRRPSSAEGSWEVSSSGIGDSGPFWEFEGGGTGA